MRFRNGANAEASRCNAGVRRAQRGNEPPFRVWDPDRPQSPCGFAFLGLKPTPLPCSQQQCLNWNDVRAGELRGSRRLLGTLLALRRNVRERVLKLTGTEATNGKLISN